MLGLRIQPRCRIPFSFMLTPCSRAGCCQSSRWTQMRHSYCGRWRRRCRARLFDSRCKLGEHAMSPHVIQQVRLDSFDTPPTPACIPVFAILISSLIRWHPIHIAASEGHVDVVQLLLLCNAAVDARFGGYRNHHCIVDENASLIFCCVVHSDICS